MAGNVATAEGATFLLERGANAIKVGIGPGGGCSTRLTTNFGIPQVEALVQCRLAVGTRVPLIADGGIRRDGAMAQALLFGGDTVMLGSAFAGTEEAPGEIVHKSVLVPNRRRWCRFRSRCSAGWRRSARSATGSTSRTPSPGELEAIGAEGIEVSVPARGSVRTVIHDMLKHLCSAVSYGGATSLDEWRRAFAADPARFLVKLSAASRVESFQR